MYEVVEKVNLKNVATDWLHRGGMGLWVSELLGILTQQYFLGICYVLSSVPAAGDDNDEQHRLTFVLVELPG